MAEKKMMKKVVGGESKGASDALSKSLGYGSSKGMSINQRKVTDATKEARKHSGDYTKYTAPFSQGIGKQEKDQK